MHVIVPEVNERERRASPGEWELFGLAVFRILSAQLADSTPQGAKGRQSCMTLRFQIPIGK